MKFSLLARKDNKDESPPPTPRHRTRTLEVLWPSNSHNYGQCEIKPAMYFGRLPSESACGSDGSVHRLGYLVYMGGADLPEDFNVHDVCTMVKRFLRSLQEKLLWSDRLIDKLLELAERPNTVTRLDICSLFEPEYEAIRMEGDKSPNSTHLGTLGYLLRQLQGISQHEHKTQMSSESLAQVFVPALFGDEMCITKIKRRPGQKDDKLRAARELAKLRGIAVEQHELPRTKTLQAQPSSSIPRLLKRNDQDAILRRDSGKKRGETSPPRGNKQRHGTATVGETIVVTPSVRSPPTEELQTDAPPTPPPTILYTTQQISTTSTRLVASSYVSKAVAAFSQPIPSKEKTSRAGVPVPRGRRSQTCPVSRIPSYRRASMAKKDASPPEDNNGHAVLEEKSFAPTSPQKLSLSRLHYMASPSVF
ncbi:unnamed protein product [Nippostrongylus brasiliensis]|uniref:Rho-GAP domain-containing protein n=1 Tax=Nippostrongylus brasiliensis TaxID=27835 RepID=A0A158R322_NIPBR|nr:unnamed protein product [Nippostrongylus brasiliensis]